MQFDRLQRRELMTLLGGAAAWPLAARAQQAAKLPTIGVLGPTTASVAGKWTAALVQRLRELGWIEGRNVLIEYGWAEGQSERAAEIAAEFVRRKVDVIVTAGTLNVVAAKRLTFDIPIVFAGAGDPVGMGLVASLARAGGNVTGLSNQAPELAPKRIELLREVVPGLRRLGIMANIGAPVAMLEAKEAEAAALTLGLESTTADIRRADDITSAIESLRGRAEALYLATDQVINTNRRQVNTLALAARLPTMHTFRALVESGGLMFYGPNFEHLFRRAAELVDKILRGGKPAEIPVEQPTRFELVINLKTAKALGLEVPPTLLARADEVIE
jgi:putative ABC transport system substrate-binding protein